MPSQSQAAGKRRIRRAADDDSDEEATQASSNNLTATEVKRMSQKLVRLALSLEHARLPIRRDLITKEILQGAPRRAFAAVFEAAQTSLQEVFGMRLEELPAKDRKKGMTMTQMRKLAHTQATAATQPGTQASQSARSAAVGTQQKQWVLRTTLSPEIRGATMGVFVKGEALYNAVSGVILVLVSMSAEQTCSSVKLNQYMHRLGWDIDTPAGKLDDVLKLMRKQGYLDSCKDDSSTEAGGVLHFLGPRGKMETSRNVKNLGNLVKKLYNAEPGSAAAKKVEASIKGTLSVALGEEEEEEDAASGDEVVYEEV
ncbi:MAGE family-domain-containing protein [Protomyces lactucae-debilis]|uniref:MAGE family-domain-containing protein n=1 Tax=Protomyces lactucae-debilis TaxID=2754530 RepID=A0A1Y2FDN7_PROLT|nr:MAGE family-domain-containing protein [Protomyces lactucae-debilis]ORY82029.1 MAGE family-domain-containing protein [Protomyces lactucae-debilis]